MGVRSPRRSTQGRNELAEVQKVRAPHLMFPEQLIGLRCLEKAACSGRRQPWDALWAGKRQEGHVSGTEKGQEAGGATQDKAWAGSTGISALGCTRVCGDSVHRDCSPPGPSVHGILQARILEWVVISFSRRSSQTQGSYPGLLHWRWSLFRLSHHLRLM